MVELDFCLDTPNFDFELGDVSLEFDLGEIGGVPGPPGPPGTQTVAKVSGAPLSEGRVVIVDGDGLLQYFDPSNVLHIARAFGITTQAANAAGVTVNVQIGGRYASNSLSLNVGQSVWAGSNGTLVASPPPGALVVQLAGVADTQTSIILNLLTYYKNG